jgi:Domain of Unknown Function (DUF1206)
VSTIGQRKAAGSDRSTARKAESKTRAIADSKPFKWLVRAGFVARGITYGVVGALALALALGAGKMGTAANQQGALALISRDWLGYLALIVIAAGLLAYALWKLLQGVLGHGPEGGGGSGVKDRVANLGGGIAYIVFFAVAVRTLAGSGGSSSGGPRPAAAGVLGWPGGPVLVALAGGVLLAVSGYQIYEAVAGDFADDAKTGRMGREQQRLFMLLGRIGITARALVFALVGYFLIRTAIEFNPSSAVGVDGALSRLHHQTLGSWLVGVVAAGLLVFATFSLFEARFRRL